MDDSNLDDNNDNNDAIVDSDYCWRNFFSAINFLRILQKLTKKKTHRILLLVQYKSSVSIYNYIIYFSNFCLIMQICFKIL